MKMCGRFAAMCVLCFAASAPAGTASAQVTIRFWGHSCFTITDSKGTTVLIDPYHRSRVGYKPFEVRPDIVLISHEHFDHNDTSWVKGNPVVLRGLDEAGNVKKMDTTIKGVRIRTVPAKHWLRPEHAARGNVAIFVIEVEGVRIAHLSDLGRPLTPQQVKRIGPVDVVMVPVGGFFTIDAEQAYGVIRQIRPRQFVIPMHYRTVSLVPELGSRLSGPEPFLRRFGRRVRRVVGNELVVRSGVQSVEPTAVLLDYLPRPGPASGPGH